jgi:predicted RNA-binding Zn ribbon-like protein
MIFAPDTEEALAAAAALVNTDANDGDHLLDVAALTTFVHTWNWSGVTTVGEADLAAVRALRPRLRSLWSSDDAAAADLVNTLLRRARALPQVIRHDDLGYHLHATPVTAPLTDRMAVEAAMAVVDVIRQGELPRLRTCAAESCHDLLVDLSKNRSRRFCSTTCANRTNMAAFRARRSQTS